VALALISYSCLFYTRAWRCAGDDGNVCLWKANFKGQWQLLSMVGGDDDDAEPTFISAKQDD
jgi:hypothetical protein